MDDGESITFTSIALILVLLIIIVMFACHYFGPRTTSWMRSNREEKIGLSKNKLFHANGYMLPSGSAFLLSNSGSFKRFDVVDKEDPAVKLSKERQQPTHTTRPSWNIPQTESEIPPQPLRPAPAAAPSKTVTFSLSRVDETTFTIFHNSPEQNGEILNSHGNSMKPTAAIRSPLKSNILPQPLGAPPPPRLSISASMAHGSISIPRPLPRRCAMQESSNGEMTKQTRQQQLTRRNSSTNPFLCDSIDNENNEENTALNSIEDHYESPTNDTGKPTSSTDLNPFVTKASQSSFSLNNDHPMPQSRNSISAMNGHQIATNDAQSNKLSQLSLQSSGLNRERNRSASTSSDNCDLRQLQSQTSPSAYNRLSNLTNGKSNPFAKAKGTHMLQKTFSEDFLFRKITFNPLGSQSTAASGENGSWSFGRSLLHQDSILNLGRRNSSQCSLDSSAGSIEELGHAISCDSVTSDSVFVSDLDQPYTQITGQLQVGLQYNKITEEGIELTVKVIEAKSLIPPFSVDALDTFVRIYLVPDQIAGAMQTQIFSDSRNPFYNETFKFWLRKQQRMHSLWFHLYHNGETHTLIGEAEMEIEETTPCSVTTWIPLSDSRKWNAQLGELMFSLSYLPTAERLTVVIVKARNLKLKLQDQEVQHIFVKAYLMNNEKKILKKRTSLKRKDRLLVFNESMIFSVPPQGLTTVQIRLTVFGVTTNDHGALNGDGIAENATTVVDLGHIVTGSCATGKGLRHWHQMLSSLRKPVSMWHVLRKMSNQPIFTGGAEAVKEILKQS